ncbi:MAG: nitroreductase, partial [Gallionella sp.]
MSNSAVDTVLMYHTRSKHAPNKYAAGPASLDWDAQPDSFRTWSGSHNLDLSRQVRVADIFWSEIQQTRVAAPMEIDNLASLLRLSVGLTAWKEYAGSRWS